MRRYTRELWENRTVSAEDEARSTAAVVGLAALKYGDLSNQAAKDYVFDIERLPPLRVIQVHISSIPLNQVHYRQIQENGGQVLQESR